MLNHPIDDIDTTIAVESSTWNNIGDAFYQNSLLYQLRQAFPNHRIVSFDGPSQRAFRPKSHIKNVFDARFRVDAGHFVFSGPILGRVFLKQYGPLIKDLTARGRSYSLLSVHVSAQGADLKALLDFLKAHPPAAVHTRDHPSFEALEEVCACAMDGICFAFFVNDLPGLPPLTRGGPYVCASYYRGWEPKFALSDPSAADIVAAGVDLDWPKQLSQKMWKYARFAEYRYPSQDSLGPWTIIRPNHNFSPLPQLNFSKKNSYLTYNPDNFLAVYKYCDGVLSDRVHAGVAGLSFGKPVKIEQVDSRYAIFDRVPVQQDNGFMRLEPGALEPFRAAMRDWLATDFATAVGLAMPVAAPRAVAP